MKTVTWLVLTTFLLLGAEHASGSEKRIILVEKATEIPCEHLGGVENVHTPQVDGGYTAQPVILSCFSAMKYHYTGGAYENEPILFRFHQPANVMPGKKYPLIVCFHGVGESGTDNKSQLAHLQYSIRYFVGPESCDFYCFAMQCPSRERSWGSSTFDQDGKGDAPLDITKEILDAVIEEYPIDEDRISLFGICSGGHAAWQLASSQPERFASLVVCSTSAPSDPLKALELTNTAIWSFNNAGDITVPIEPCRQAISAINQKGGLALISESPISSHDSWWRALRDYGAFKWMSLQSRKSNWPPPGHLPKYQRTFISSFFSFYLPCILIVGLLWYIKKVESAQRV